MWDSDQMYNVHSPLRLRWVTPGLPVWIYKAPHAFLQFRQKMMFRVSRGLVMTTIDTVRCQPLWNQLLCFCSQPAHPWQHGKKLKLDSNFRIENWHWAERNRSEAMHFVWSLVIRSVVTTRCEDWPIRGQECDTGTNQTTWFWPHFTTNFNWSHRH